MLYYQQSHTKNKKFKYEIFSMSSKSHYDGESYLAAIDLESALKQFQDFLNEDKDNKQDSWGYYKPEPTGMYTDELFFEKKIYYRG